MNIALYDRDTKPFTIEQFSYDLYDIMTSGKNGTYIHREDEKEFYTRIRKSALETGLLRD